MVCKNESLFKIFVCFIFFFLHIFLCLSLNKIAIVYLGFSWTTSGKHYVTALLLGTFSKMSCSSSEESNHYFRGFSKWYSTCVIFCVISAALGSISSLASIASLVFRSFINLIPSNTFLNLSRILFVDSSVFALLFLSGVHLIPSVVQLVLFSAFSAPGGYPCQLLMVCLCIP